MRHAIREERSMYVSQQSQDIVQQQTLHEAIGYNTYQNVFASKYQGEEHLWSRDDSKPILCTCTWLLCGHLAVPSCLHSTWCIRSRQSSSVRCSWYWLARRWR